MVTDGRRRARHRVRTRRRVAGGRPGYRGPVPLALEPGLHPGSDFALGWVALGAVLVASVTALTHQSGRAWSASLLYVSVGLVAAAVIDALGVRWLDPVSSPDAIVRITELAIVVALFANGVRLDRDLRPGLWRPTIRLLGVVMPLTIGAVVLLGTGVLGLSLGAAIVLGAALAPTDPVLAGDVGETSPGHEESEPEFAITSEASLNDGLAAPFLVLGLLVAGEGVGWGSWLGVDVLARIGIGVVVGVGVGALAGTFVPDLRERGLVTTAYDGLLTAGLALLSYGAGEVAGGYGFLSAFVAGVAFRRRERGHATHGEVHEGAERIERMLELVVLLVVSTSVTTAVLDAPGWEGWVVAAATVVVVRPVLGYVSLMGTDLADPGERAYVAWFGVRGVGTLYYASAAVAAGVLAPGEAATVWWTAVAAVLVSIAVHGLTSGPATRLLSGPR